MKTINGIIHGTTIELSSNPGLADGEVVEVQIRPVADTIAPAPSQYGELPVPPAWYPGCIESAGGLLADVWTEQDDQILAEIERQRELTFDREIME